MKTMDLKDELDPEFTRRQWAVQRAGWALLLLVVAGSLVGFFGTSPLSSRTETREVGDARYEVDHPRFSRYQLVERIHLRVAAPSATGEELRVSFSNDYLESVSIRGSAPEPDGGGAGPGGGEYVYAVSDWSRPVVVAFEVEPQKAFRLPGTMTVEAGGLPPVELPLDAWVHP